MIFIRPFSAAGIFIDSEHIVNPERISLINFKDYQHLKRFGIKD